jgi:hypothetical protein
MSTQIDSAIERQLTTLSNKTELPKRWKSYAINSQGMNKRTRGVYHETKELGLEYITTMNLKLNGRTYLLLDTYTNQWCGQNGVPVLNLLDAAKQNEVPVVTIESTVSEPTTV